MKKSVTYREITVAIGIVVAVVIALTLWIRVPETGVSDAKANSRLRLPTTAKILLENTRDVFSFR